MYYSAISTYNLYTGGTTYEYHPSMNTVEYDDDTIRYTITDQFSVS